MNLTLSHFEELMSSGYTLDMVFVLLSIDNGCDVCNKSAKIDAICQSLRRKSLVNDDMQVTPIGKAVLSFVNSDTPDEKPLIKKKVTEDEFDTWWKAYPGTDSFTYRGKEFVGTRSLRQKKDDCKAKFKKIVSEGEYTAKELIESLEYEVKLKKENSIKTKTNKLSFMQNSLTYLNQRTFEPFIELIREGKTVKEEQEVQGGTDI